jgi:type I restriction enzyme S subunit
MTNLPKSGIELLFHDNKFVKLPEESAEGTRTRVRLNDILISITAELGKIGFINHDIGEAYVNQHVALVRIDDPAVNPRYLAHYLASQPERNRLNRLNDSGAKSGLSLQTISRFPVLLPSLPEQKAIADLLSTWDKAIGKTDRLIQAKERRFKWLLQELISEPRNTLNGAKWEVVKLGELFGKDIKVEKGKVLAKDSNSDGRIPVVAGGQTYAYFTSCLTHDVPTVTISASGAYAGFVWYHDYPIWASDCIVIYATVGVTKFLYFTLKAIQHKIYALQSGGAQPHVYSKDLKNLLVIWPSPEHQQQTADTLSFAQHEIDLLKQLAEQYKTQKRGLMQKMLTGEWRVKLDVVKRYA